MISLLGPRNSLSQNPPSVIILAALHAGLCWAADLEVKDEDPPFRSLLVPQDSALAVILLVCFLLSVYHGAPSTQGVRGTKRLLSDWTQSGRRGIETLRGHAP